MPLTALVADESTRHLVLEMGARMVGDITYLTEVAPPRVGLVLNVGAAHLGPFGGKEGIARAKSELVQALPSASRRCRGAQRRRRARCRDGRGHDRPRRHLRRVDRMPASVPSTCRSTTRAGPASCSQRSVAGHCSRQSPRARQAPGLERSRRSRCRAQPRDVAGQGRRGAERGRVAQPLADAGDPAPRRRDGRQRRLQRQPRFDARRPGCTRLDGAERRRPHLGRARRDARARRGVRR